MITGKLDEQKARDIYRLVVKKLKELSEINNFNGPFGETTLSLKNLNENKFFEYMVNTIFSGGFKGKIVAQKWNEIKKAFLDFDVAKVAEFSESDIRRLERNRKIIRNKAKIIACINNARKILELKKEFESIAEYLKSWKTSWSLQNDVIRRFEFIGTTTVYDLLKSVGYDFMKPDVHLRRFFYRLGLIGSQDDTEVIRQEIQNIGYLFSKSNKKSVGHIDSVLFAYSAGWTGINKAICGNRPLCEECTIRKFCNYSRTGYKGR